MEIQMSDQTTDTTVEAPATDATPVQLQLQDLLLAAQVVQLASSRGAIKAEEMEAVGGLYNRLVTFLQASGALQPTPAPAPADTTADTTADTPAPAADATPAQ
jgi:hypothetical protein